MGRRQSGRRCAHQNRIGDENDETGSDGDATPRGVRERDRGDLRRRRVLGKKSFPKITVQVISMQLVGENLADLKRDVESSSSSSIIVERNENVRE